MNKIGLYAEGVPGSRGCAMALFSPRENWLALFSRGEN